MKKADLLHHLIEHFLGEKLTLDFFLDYAVSAYIFNYVIPKTIFLGDPFFLSSWELSDKINI